MRTFDEIYLTQIHLFRPTAYNQQFMRVRLKVDPQLINFHTDTFMMDVPIANRALIDSHKQSIKGREVKNGQRGD